jgi:hypothetical protein
MEKTLELLMECPAADDGTCTLVRRSYLAILPGVDSHNTINWLARECNP